MIDLTPTRNVLIEAGELIDELHGIDLDDSEAVTSQSKGALRQLRAQRSQELQLLASRLELAAQLVRVEYWYARGESDPLNPEREDGNALPGD